MSIRRTTTFVNTSEFADSSSTSSMEVSENRQGIEGLHFKTDGFFLSPEDERELFLILQRRQNELA